MSQRDPRLPEPTPDQIIEAKRSRRNRESPTFATAKGFDDYLEWFAASSDPFAEAFLASHVQSRDAVIAQDGREEVRPLPPEKVEKLRSLATTSIQRLTDKQQAAMDQLRSLVDGLDPLPLICGMIFATRAERWSSYFEPDTMPRDLDLELVVSIVASSPIPESWRPCQVDDWRTVSEAAKEVRMWAYTLSLAYDYANESSPESTFRREMLQRWLAYRGDAYTPHATSLAESLAQGKEQTLLDRCGYGVDDLIRLGSRITNRWNQRLTPALAAAWDAAAKVLDEAPSSIGAASDDFKHLWYEGVLTALPWVMGTPLGALGADTDNDRARAMVEDLGWRPGEAPAFTSVFVDVPQRTKPFMILPSPRGKAGPDVALLVHPAALTTDLHLTVESLLSKKIKNWERARADAVDAHVLGLLKEALPGSVGYSQVFIELAKGRAEIDGILLYEDIVIVMEGKGAPLKTAARRGGVNQYITQLKLLISEGSSQLDRDYHYVMNGLPAKFYKTANSSRPLIEVDGSKVRRCYQLLPTLDGLADIGTRVRRLNDWGVLDARCRPWIVGATHLNVVTDTLRRPAELLGYLEFRERWVGHPQLVILDELEMLALYLYQVDLDQRLTMLGPNSGSIMHMPHQYEFDEQYAYLEGRGISVPPLRIKTTARVRRFVDELQRTRPDGWLASATAAFQIPITVATALDLMQSTLAREAKVDGIATWSDGTHAIIVIRSHDSARTISSRRLQQAAARYVVSIVLEQKGGRTHLKQVIYNGSAPKN
ncbi:hypothetical protein [Micromonospora chokoriensis]|uniref:hypothetical protein n=1 Tax=Micromonospora chokoriensis TaxID=356851 RepID=UPI0012F73F2F|nr:hypothetical protein [Micromonospora chokoriensis]